MSYDRDNDRDYDGYLSYEEIKRALRRDLGWKAWWRMKPNDDNIWKLQDEELDALVAIETICHFFFPLLLHLAIHPMFRFQKLNDINDVR